MVALCDLQKHTPMDLSLPAEASHATSPALAEVRDGVPHILVPVGTPITAVSLMIPLNRCNFWGK